MNIGVDIRSLMTPQRTGVGEYTYELLNALFSLDRENEYFLFYNSYTDVSRYIPKWQYDNVRYVATRYPNKLFNASLQLFKYPKLDDLTLRHSEPRRGRRIPLIIAQKQGILHSLSQTEGVQDDEYRLDYFFSPNLNFTALSKNVKHILTIHDLSFEFFPDCFSWKQRAWHQLVRPREQCKRAYLILTPSENTKRDVVEYYGVPEEKVRVVQPGISGVFSGTWNMEHGTKNTVKTKYQLPNRFILFLGTVEPRKNIEGIIQAYRSICSMLHAPCSMLIAGALGWKYREILRLIEQTPGVRYIGYVHEADKPALCQLADVFVYPSLYEGFGFPVLEAMASGTPVITSNRSSLPEVVGDSAYLVNPYNISEIARGIEILTTDEKLRTTLIERGKKQAEKFLWERSARELVMLFTNTSKQ